MTIEEFEVEPPEQEPDEDDMEEDCPYDHEDDKLRHNFCRNCGAALRPFQP